MKHDLEEGERAEADDIYVGEAPKYIKCPKSMGSTKEEEEMEKSVQGRHEVINKRFKHFQCLNQKTRCSRDDKLEKHNACFRACVVITQVAMELGYGELWKLDYEDNKDDE